MGVKVVPVMSDPPKDWSGDTGYVQNVFKDKADISTNPDGIVAFCAGQYELGGELQALFAEASVPEGRVLLNF